MYFAHSRFSYGQVQNIVPADIENQLSTLVKYLFNPFPGVPDICPVGRYVFSKIHCTHSEQAVIYISVPADRGKNVDSYGIFFVEGEPPELCTVNVEVTVLYILDSFSLKLHESGTQLRLNPAPIRSDTGMGLGLQL